MEYVDSVTDAAVAEAVEAEDAEDAEEAEEAEAEEAEDAEEAEEAEAAEKAEEANAPVIKVLVLRWAETQPTRSTWRARMRKRMLGTIDKPPIQLV